MVGAGTAAVHETCFYWSLSATTARSILQKWIKQRFIFLSLLTAVVVQFREYSVSD
jgi:uncharacterized protein involved in response to NO